MKTAIVRLLCLSLFLIPSHENMALAFTIALVAPAPTAGSGCTENNANTANVGTANSTVTVGDVITLEVNVGPGFTVTSIVNGTGATGLAWNHVSAADCTEAVGGAGTTQVWYAVVANSSINGAAVTVNSSVGNGFTGVCMIEWSGLANPVIVDPASTFANTSSTASANLLSANISIGAAQELLLSPASFSQVLATPCTAANGGFTFTGLDCGTGGDGLGGSGNGYLITSVKGSYQSKMVQSVAGAGCVTLVGFLGAGQSLAQPNNRSVFVVELKDPLERYRGETAPFSWSIDR